MSAKRNTNEITNLVIIEIILGCIEVCYCKKDSKFGKIFHNPCKRRRRRKKVRKNTTNQGGLEYERNSNKRSIKRVSRL